MPFGKTVVFTPPALELNEMLLKAGVPPELPVFPLFPLLFDDVGVGVSVADPSLAVCVEVAVGIPPGLDRSVGELLLSLLLVRVQAIVGIKNSNTNNKIDLGMFVSFLHI